MLAAIIVAAGSSRRMGFDKLFASLNGLPVVAHSIQAFENCASVQSITVVTAPERFAAFDALAASRNWKKVQPLTTGGEQRHLSVWNGLQALPAGADSFVAVHDGARPLITPAAIEACFQLARETNAACCAAPVTDTLKRVDNSGRLVGGVDRENLWAMQTPQIFATDVLLRAYSSVIASGAAVTDEASALESLGVPVSLVESGDFNFKITYPPDLALAASILRLRTASSQNS